MIYLQLFFSFLQIGLFGFGGGMAIMSLIQNQVQSHGWMSETEFLDIVAISQVTPGPIGINCATYVGYTATGTVFGSILATFAIILPSLVIMGIICKLYFVLENRFHENMYFQNTLQALRWVVIGIIAAAAFLLISPDSFTDAYSWIIFAIVLVITILPAFVEDDKCPQWLSWASHPIVLMVLAGIVGWWIYR